jgi:hypothetical protein
MEIETLFNLYRNKDGDLTQEQLARVMNYSPIKIDYSLAEQSLSEAHRFMGHEDEGSRPSESSINLAAKLIGALKNEIPKESRKSGINHLWVQFETSILAEALALQNS